MRGASAAPVLFVVRGPLARSDVNATATATGVPPPFKRRQRQRQHRHYQQDKQELQKEVLLDATATDGPNRALDRVLRE